MPKERAEFVSTALDLVNKASPMKSKAFHQAGLTSSNLLHDGIMEAVASGLAALCKTESIGKFANITQEVFNKR